MSLLPFPFIMLLVHQRSYFIEIWEANKNGLQVNFVTSKMCHCAVARTRHFSILFSVNDRCLLRASNPPYIASDTVTTGRFERPSQLVLQTMFSFGLDFVFFACQCFGKICFSLLILCLTIAFYDKLHSLFPVYFPGNWV